MAVGNIGMVKQIQPKGLDQRVIDKPDKNQSTDFKEALSQQLDIKKSEAQKSDVKSSVNFKFSNHAVERMRSRGVSFSPDQLQKIDKALEKAAEKGAKETLMLTNDSALVVSVKNKTVVTVMDRESIRDNVFTKIDSTVVI